MAVLDPVFVRAQFPAFSEPALRDRVFLDNAGGSYPCRFVVDRLGRFYRERKMQPYGPAEPSRLGGLEMDEARSRLAAMMGVAPDELCFGPSTSANTYVLAQAFGAWLPAGAAVVVTDQDHEANSGVWRRMAAARGLELREWRLDPDSGCLDPAGLARLLDDRVRLVCFPHASNIVGAVNPVTAICEMVRAAGAVTCVDGVSYAPHGLPDVGGLGADIYLLSTYKTWGPHQGLMTIRRDLAMALPNQAHFFNDASPASRLSPAGPDHAQVAACAGIADYIDALHAHHFPDRGETGPRDRAADVHDLIRRREEALMVPVLARLAGRNDLRLIGPAQPSVKAPTLALAHRRPGADLARALAAEGIMAGGGSFYADRTLTALGIEPAHGVLRLSFLHYTTEAELDRALDALDRVL